MKLAYIRKTEKIEHRKTSPLNLCELLKFLVLIRLQPLGMQDFDIAIETIENIILPTFARASRSIIRAVDSLTSVLKGTASVAP
jgi:hypothetical protein